MRIAMIGQRGVPATFGGIERHVEELGARLAARGHEVIVYCRTSYTGQRPREHRGMVLRYLHAPSSKHFEAIVHSAVSTVAAMRTRPDVIHYHALGPGLLAPLPRLSGGARVVLTVHGLDDQRAKWNAVARRVLGLAQWTSARVPHTTIGVSRALVAHYARRHRRRIVYIPNGVVVAPPCGSSTIRSLFGLEPRSYVLFVGRLVPEKAPDLLVRAFRAVPTGARLVLAGGSSNTDGYAARLRELARGDRRVLLTGYVYGTVLAELYANAALFVQPSSLEGLPLTLLEAASHATPVLASDIEPNLEIVGGDGPGHRVFPAGDEARLATALGAALGAGDAERAGARELRASVTSAYCWERATRDLEQVYLTGGIAPDPARRGGT